MAIPDFEIVTTGERNAPVIEVHGEIDFATARDLHTAISAALGPGVPQLVVDMAHVTFIDSSGMSALVRANISATALGTKFQIRNATGNAHRALETCGLVTLLS